MEAIVERPLSDDERAWALRAIARKRLFRTLSWAGVAVAAVLAAAYGWRSAHDPGFALAPHAVVVLLVLLNARQNLRQHRYAALLEKLVGPPGPPAAR